VLVVPSLDRLSPCDSIPVVLLINVHRNNGRVLLVDETNNDLKEADVSVNSADLEKESGLP
jgi:hypothetical protein